MKNQANNFIQTASFLFLSCLLCTVTHGQSNDTAVKKEIALKKMYVQAATGPSTQNGAVYEFGLQAVLKHNWVATFSYQNIEMDPKGLPSDYEQGYTYILVLPFPDVYPVTKMNLFSFTGGKCFEMGRKIWFTTEAGFSIVNGDNMTFTPQDVTDDGMYISSNYAVKKENKTTIGAMLKADFNWAFSSYVGLGVGAFANFSSIQSPVGIQVKLISGWLRKKRGA